MVSKQVIVFDLDSTLAISKQPLSDEMAELLTRLLEKYRVGVISGGKFGQFQKQVIDRLSPLKPQFDRLYILPTSGANFWRFEGSEWTEVYNHKLEPHDAERIQAVLEAGAKELGFWEAKPWGDIIEDRGTQVTFSALGQQAPPDAKKAWDPDRSKKVALKDYAAQRLPEFEVRVGGTTSVDVTKVGMDKGFGVGELMKVLGLTKDDILFIGDELKEGGNDYPVKALGVDCIEVDSVDETAQEIRKLLAE